MDLNGDDIADAVRPEGVLLSSRSSTVGLPNYSLALEPSGFAWSQAAAGDFDGNGRLDLVLAQSGRSRLEVRLQNEQGILSPRIIGSDTPPTQIVTADFDGDDIDDIAWISGAGSERSVHVTFGGDFEVQTLHRDDAELRLDVIDADIDARLRDAFADLRVSGGSKPHVFFGSAERTMRAPFLFGEATAESVVGSFRAGEELVVVTDVPARWRGSSLDDLSRGDWPSCLAQYPPQCLLRVSGRSAAVFVGPTGPCDGSAVFVQTQGSSCESSSVDPQVRFTDLSYDTARGFFIATAVRGSAGRVFLLADTFADVPAELEFDEPVLSAAAADLDSDGEPEILALTPAGVRPRRGSNILVPQDVLELAGLTVEGEGRIRVFDSDGDRLDDLVIGTQTRLSLYRGLPRAAGGGE